MARLFVMAILTLTATSVFAQTRATFRTDLSYLQNAIQQAGHNTSILRDLMVVRPNSTEAKSLSVGKTPWGALYMPMQDGGIATRWQINESATDRPIWQGENGQRLNQAQIIAKLKAMTPDQIDKQLSPIRLVDDLSELTAHGLGSRFVQNRLIDKIDNHHIADCCRD